MTFNRHRSPVQRLLTLALGYGLLVAACSDPAPVQDAGMAEDAGVTVDSGPAADSGFVDRATWVDPPSWEPDGNGVFHLRMEAAAIEIDGTTYCLRTWNGTVPGPTMRVPAQENGMERQIRIDFENAMQGADMQPVGPPGPPGPDTVLYDFNQTNLHTHGLHVQPENATGTSFLADNVLVHHAAGATAEYRFDIDEDQAIRGRPHEPGTFWYHPHVHGSTSIQVANGMAGAFIIEGDVDALPGIAESNERIFIMTHIPLETATPLAPGASCEDATISVNDFGDGAANPSSVQVNGVLLPRIVVPPAQVERWRLLHGGVTQQMDLSIRQSTDDSCGGLTGAPLTVHQIAQDGITLHAMNERDHIFMAPGNRADIMVTAPSEEGVYCLYSQTAGPGPGGPDEMMVAILEVDSDAGTPTGALPANTDLDATALPLLDCGGPVDGTQLNIFSQQVDELGEVCEGGGPPIGPGGPDIPGPLRFNINCETFDHNEARHLQVDRVEEWQLNSEGGGSHPFHIHINPFMVCSGSIAGETQVPHWRDTVWVQESGSRDPSLLIRYPTETYTGSFVSHCHKLHHEDQGMMQIITIDP